jgi:hypothetical protein
LFGQHFCENKLARKDFFLLKKLKSEKEVTATFPVKSRFEQDLGR